MTGVIILAAACSSETQSPLPSSTTTVDADSPLNRAQAQDIRLYGRELMASVINSVEPHGATLNEERAEEQWSGCTAKSTPTSFGINYNGVLYSADVPFDAQTPFTEAQIHQFLAALPIAWTDSDTNRGTSDIYSVTIVSTDPLLMSVTSPCYFLKEAEDSGTISEADKRKVTGFTSKLWADE